MDNLFDKLAHDHFSNLHFMEDTLTNPMLSKFQRIGLEACIEDTKAILKRYRREMYGRKKTDKLPGWLQAFERKYAAGNG